MHSGRCVLGSRCQHPKQELRPSHKCPDCDQFLHVLCGIYDDKRDKFICGCAAKLNNISFKTTVPCTPTCQEISEDATPNGSTIEIHQDEHNALVSTITQSTAEEDSRIIPRDYFIQANQKINKASLESDGETYKNLRRDIVKQINDKLKSMMLMKAQEIGLEVLDKSNDRRRVQSYRDIGLAWKQDDSSEIAAKINTIVNTTFANNSGYEYYIEGQIMKNFNLKYDDDATTKGSIARMIVLRKCELAKVVNKRSENTHQKKILKTRSSEATKNQSRRKMNQNCFRINQNWYNNDGSAYDKNKPRVPKNDNTIFYVEKIRKLENELKMAKKV